MTSGWRGTPRIEEIGWRLQVETGAGIAAEILDLVPKALPGVRTPRRRRRRGACLDDGGASATATSAATRRASTRPSARFGTRERAGDDALVLDAYRLIGVAAIWGPMPLAEAERRYGHLLDRVDGGPLRKAAPLELVASLKTQLGDVAGGRALIARLRELYEELGDRLLGAKAALIDHRGPLGEGDFATAEAILAEACALLEAAGESSWYSTAEAVRAGALYELGRLDEATEATVRSEAAGAADDVVTQSYWRAERAKVLARSGRGEEAVALAREAVRLITATDGLLEQADVYVAVGETNRVLGHPDEAREAFTEALRRYEAKGAEPFAVLDAALASLGLPAETGPTTPIDVGAVGVEGRHSGALRRDVDSLAPHTDESTTWKRRPVISSGSIDTNRGLGAACQGNKGRSRASKRSYMSSISTARPLITTLQASPEPAS